MPSDVLDDLLLTDDDATGAFALDELFADGSQTLLTDDFDDEYLADLVDSVSRRR